MISLEDLPIYKYLSPPQTTVSQPLSELARLAVTTMLKLCDGAEPQITPLNLVLQTELIERDSVVMLPS